ncbi:cytochrome d ubiquinol oxidase subunit II [Lysinibacillus sphaericus]|uniref:Cytochrome D Ubiquinol oxidase subunit II n=2 Tax=Lysinibacillus TaxID=400634 RepID=A0A2S0K5S0_LYSSH|nr:MULTISPECIES: cytochrome d ubiquinol oxidase subunit II [Lysinibacillus]AHN20234.1 cytochrome D ubiquinol oxidase subunit II [Lysinibacillus varians]AVK98725.1 cytochrome D ubiquinol oxidase subunit II [Lysinibacillus sphaericus]MCS1384736.1 cytochrome d ubiquinol oxidase subunit II [Lysinibacillus sphaericus]MED4544358.1 cytochrome d ubiquinol oxidase subunit II [Lysinibacillus sphaericus]TKI21339.1 cytochrome d ubiquinol oxidase subunit II [Lysinibacillus sphaericus]
MSLEVLGISVLWLFLFGYVIVASIDFGAGFFNAYSVMIGKDHILSQVIKRYLSPVWEITNVFLVFFFVGIVGFFPQSAYYYGTILLVPVSISLILIAIRGSYYAFESYSAKSGHIGYKLMYGVTGLFIPASLSIVLTISEGGFVTMVKDQPHLEIAKLFTSPLTWSIVLLSVVAVLYISAVFLTWYGKRANDEHASDLMRKYALGWSIPLVASVIGIMVELKGHNPAHYENMLNLWWLFAMSGVLFIMTLILLGVKKKYGLAVILLVVQFGFAFFGYGISHYPYLLYPYLSVHDSFTNESMAIALVIAFIGGLVLLIPSLYLVMKWFVFDRDYACGKRNHHV